jgi:hypothetical protein
MEFLVLGAFVLLLGMTMNEHYSHGFWYKLSRKEQNSGEKSKLRHEDFDKRFKEFQKENNFNFQVDNDEDLKGGKKLFRLSDRNDPKRKLEIVKSQKRISTMYDPDDAYLENDCDEKGQKIPNRWWLGKTKDEISKIKRESRVAKRLDDEEGLPSENDYKHKMRDAYKDKKKSKP